ncbi:hypothetical protein IQ241_21475 [Romeria aff. gracilis LEGE 07310]|uniref:Uncharacterized protein n=1 Tax=Vasconcelosia minhoensis LEGE 07310 TaxID=915328 RepID=A0A8J7AY64_9CYAN|nr:hypothetical protein [Romeria gracilis]MBE9079833.1 hypothetical protein [Romeria aff. gracilis LEGE 07310]
MEQFDSTKGAEQATFLPPSGSISNPAGFVAPAILQSQPPLAMKQMMAKVAEQLAHDPMAMRQFCDRIYQLLCDDIRAQQERAQRYGRRH